MTLVAPKTVVVTSVHGQLPLNMKPSLKGCSLQSRNFAVGPVCYVPDNLELSSENDGPSRKRKRLTHLTNEERMLRRKLKNRVAAQTARDRKKQRMDDLEIALTKLEEENRKLQEENFKLLQKTEYLAQENAKIKERLCMTSSENATEPEIRSNFESAELTPQQKARIQSLVSLAFLLMISLTHSSSSWSSWQSKCLISRLQTQLQDLQPFRQQLPPKLERHLAEKWWGPHQRSWNPSAN